jgi:hypothetical protein
MDQAQASARLLPTHYFMTSTTCCAANLRSLPLRKYPPCAGFPALLVLAARPTCALRTIARRRPAQAG